MLTQYKHPEVSGYYRAQYAGSNYFETRWFCADTQQWYFDVDRGYKSLFGTHPYDKWGKLRPHIRKTRFGWKCGTCPYDTRYGCTPEHAYTMWKGAYK